MRSLGLLHSKSLILYLSDRNYITGFLFKLYLLKGKKVGISVSVIILIDAGILFI